MGCTPIPKDEFLFADLPNKNQWLTLYALRNLSLPVVVTGAFLETTVELFRDVLDRQRRHGLDVLRLTVVFQNATILE